MSKKKKVLPVLLMIWPYLPILLIFVEDPSGILPFVFDGLAVLVYILNIINAFTYKSANQAKELAHYDMVIKLVHIPFYLMIFVFGVLMLATMLVPALTGVAPIVIIMLAIVDALLMVTSSMYGVSAALKGVRSGQISGGKAVLLTVMHFIFALDVISAIILHASMKKSVPEAVQQNV